MRARATVASILASGAVLIGGWQLGSAGIAATAPTTTSASDASGTGAAPAPPTSSGTAAPSAAPSTAPSTAADGTYAGAVERTRFGDVQVQITVNGGAITEVTALHLTDHDGRSVSISNRAAPILREEVLAAQSSQVQTVSGATYTTDAYLSSVQSAIDQAGL